MKSTARVRGAALAAIVAAAACVGSEGAQAGDLTVFIGEPSPRESWGRVYGAALTSSVVPFLGFEGEASRVSADPSVLSDTSMTAFTASAVVSPPIAFVTPYGGVGAGVFRQSTGAGDSDTGRLTAVFGGVKVKTAGVLVLKAEYRKINLSGTPFLKLDRRITVGAGVSF